MNRELLGVVLAVLASLSFESGYVLMTQAVDASRACRDSGAKNEQREP